MSVQAQVRGVVPPESEPVDCSTEGHLGPLSEGAGRRLVLEDVTL